MSERQRLNEKEREREDAHSCFCHGTIIRLLAA